MTHLEDVNEDYWTHWKFAIRLGLVMVLAGGCVMIHAFIPQVFKDTGSKVIPGWNH